MDTGVSLYWLRCLESGTGVSTMRITAACSKSHAYKELVNYATTCRLDMCRVYCSTGCYKKYKLRYTGAVSPGHTFQRRPKRSEGSTAPDVPKSKTSLFLCHKTFSSLPFSTSTLTQWSIQISNVY